jgi:PAS domain S-box-containing protein
MARAIREHDWSSTPLGPIGDWPISLRTAVGYLTASSVPMVLLWGQEGVLIYNDGYARFAGRRHPELLGMGAREGWPEIADFNDGNIRRGLAGEAWSLRDQELVLDRRGAPEAGWMDLDYTPVPQDDGTPGGVMVLVTETTERRIAEERLRAAVERLDLALSAGGGIGAWDWDVPADLVVADPRFSKLYGVDPDRAALGAPVAEFFVNVHPDDLPVLQGAIDRALNGGGTLEAEYRLVGPNGDVRWVIAVGRPIRDQDGRVVRLPGVSFDITERRESEARYRTLFNKMDEGFCIIEFFDGPHGPDSDYIHIEANPAYAANAGIENVVGQKLREMVGDEAQAWVDRYGEVLKTGKPIRFEQELVATGRWLELSAFRIEPPERKQVAVLFQDLTERKKAELALRDSETRYRSLFDTMDEGFCVIEMKFDEAGTPVDYLFLETNPAFTRHTGLENAAGRWMRDLAPDHEQHWFDIYGQIAKTGEPVRFEQTAEALGFFYDVYAFRVGDADDNRVAILFNDITRRRQNELALKELNATLEARVVERTEELTRAHEALRQSQKMEAVGQLTGGIAHDFNNLLAGISGSLELLGKRLSEGRLNGMDRYIDAAQGSAQRAASLTQRLLAFSRRQTLDPRPTDVNRLINGMEELIRRSVGPDVEVEVVGAGGLWAAKVDQSQLENALLNLCINGRDAMAPGGGRLTIETSNKWLDDRAAKARDLPPGQYVSLCVTDTGVGMSPETQAQAFDPFFTTKPLGQGTGLGLSMIHGFVRQSGGQVRIYSEIGKGTTMCIYLPRHLGDVDSAGEHGLTPVVEGGHGETVLVIDDETTVRMLVAEVLGEAGYNVIEAPDGPSGLEILRSDRRIDLLISDVGLPGGMNGRQVADAARVTRPDLKVLFITGYAENAAVGNGLLAPGMEVLTKPFVMGDLSLKVHDMIEGVIGSDV